MVKPNEWKRIKYTNIFLTCDEVGVDKEYEFRKLLVQQPTLIEEWYFKIKMLFVSKKNYLSIERPFPSISLIEI